MKKFHPLNDTIMKNFFFLCALLPLTASAASTTFVDTWNVSTAIPDNDDVGYTDTHVFSTPNITEIEHLSVNLNFSGGWNGDVYLYLAHDSGFSVLLNRPGRSAS